MLWRLPLRIFWWLFGGIIRAIVALALLLGLAYFVMRLTPIDEFWRARFYARIGKVDDAEHWYRLGLKQHPKSKFAPKGHYELAELLYSQERYREAISHYGKALEGGLTPEEKREALLKIAESYLKSGEPLNAGKRFEQFAQLFREDERASKALFLAGESYRKAKRKDDARRCWQKLSASYPTSPFAPKALWSLAELAESEGNEDLARQIYLKLVERYPQSAEAAKANARLAVWHYRQGDYKAAAKAYSEAIKAAPELLKEALQSEAVKKFWQKLKE
ncbi:MAG: tetratricopeptide repeat protein, partial [Armatimonadetes bacterium]|nr:tetratricopeptide repeat protein [Armatimonadota bacterium]